MGLFQRGYHELSELVGVKVAVEEVNLNQRGNCSGDRGILTRGCPWNHSLNFLKSYAKGLSITVFGNHSWQKELWWGNLLTLC